MREQIKPYGGKLINRIAGGQKKESLMEKAFTLKEIRLGRREVSDLEMIATGAFSPLEGFMGKRDYENVLDAKRLSNGLPWTIPVTLSVGEQEAKRLKEGEDISLLDPAGVTLGILHLEEKYAHDRAKEADQVYGTGDRKHPGVDKLYRTGEVLLGGKVTVIRLPRHNDFLNYRLTPEETRRLFRERGWRRIAAFQTRNPIHRAHEYIQTRVTHYF